MEPMKACNVESCEKYMRRYYSKYCTGCGNALAEIVKCCAEEDLTDAGFCKYCGERKWIRWAE